MKPHHRHKPLNGQVRRRFEALLKRELLGEPRVPLAGDAFAEQAAYLQRQSRKIARLPRGSDPVIGGMDDEPITMRSAFAEDFAQFREDLASAAVHAALRGDARFFRDLANALEREASRSRIPDLRTVRIIKGQLAGETIAATAHRVAVIESEEMHDRTAEAKERRLEAVRKRIVRLRKLHS